MTDLIKLVGGFGKAKKILENAPDWAVSVNLHNGMYYELSEYEKCDTFLSAFRQAIADHDRTDTCVGIGKIDSLHPEFAKVLHDNFLDLITDNCSDIKNPLSPSTEVIER